MKTLALFLGLCLMSISMFSQQVITVDNRANSGANYTGPTALQDAIAAASVGDIIQIHPSATSYGSITIIIPLTLVGLGHNPANSKDGERAVLSSIQIGGNATGTLITGLTLNAIYSSGSSSSNNVKIINNRITGYIQGEAGNVADNWVIEGNIFVDGYVYVVGSQGWITKNNIFDNTYQWVIYEYNNTCSFLNNLVVNSTLNFAWNSVNPIVNNNLFILRGSIQSVGLQGGSTITFNNNLTRNVSGLTVTALSGSNNLNNTLPGFSFTFANISNYYTNNYNVTGAALTAATDGGPLGVFGASSFPFDPHGRPRDWSYMTTLNISNSSVPMGQNIDVTFTAAKKN